MILNGTIQKGIGGFYYVEAAGAVYECKARGAFRRQKITPLVGDHVEITIRDTDENTIDVILPRKNALQRPPIANLDQLVLVVSVCEPAPNLLVLDQLIAIAESQKIEPAVVVTKADLGEAEALVELYRRAGFPAYAVSCQTKNGIEQIYDLLSKKVSAFTGNSGVGKSTLLNLLDARLELATGGISDKLGRGRHTTRQVQLFQVRDGFIADTPGFSSLDFEHGQRIGKEDLPFCFREFLPLLGSCRFSSCTHMHDQGCKIVEAVEQGLISKSRHDSYIALYEQAKEYKEWERR